MIELSDTQFEKLKKDADDNRQIIRIVRFAIIFVSIIILYITLAMPMINNYIRSQEEYLKQQTSIEQAKTNAEIMEIEKGSMTMDEYIKWLSVRKD